MTVVIDASVAAKWFFPEEGSAEARALLTAETIVAPDLIVPEVVNIAWRKVRVGDAEADAVVDLGVRLLQVIDDLVPSAGLAERALALGLSLDHPTYDCFYLALSESRDLPLVTADDRFARRLAATVWSARLRPLVP